MFEYFFGLCSGLLLYHFLPRIKEGLISMMKKAAREVIKEEDRKDRVAKEEASEE